MPGRALLRLPSETISLEDFSRHEPPLRCLAASEPADEACYTRHTDYVLYGGIRAKWRGMRHVYVQYLGTRPAPADIHLYTPYNNRECLHCHLGARSFEESATHAAIRDEVISNQVSCISSGCHDTVHNVASLANVKFWKGKP
jgi:hypothetical protein